MSGMFWKSCMISDCPNDVRARGVCIKHYRVWQRHGNAAYVAGPEGREVPRREWCRFGADGAWSTELDEPDRLATVGTSPRGQTRFQADRPAPVLDETNSRICRRCYTQVPQEHFAADESLPIGLASVCTPCVEARRDLGKCGAPSSPTQIDPSANVQVAELAEAA